MTQFLFLVSRNLPEMRNVVWAVDYDEGVCGYICYDENCKITVDACKADLRLRDAGVSKIMCLYFYQSFYRCSILNEEEMEVASKYNTLLEQVKYYTTKRFKK